MTGPYPLYWRIYQRPDGTAVVVCMQDFDEIDYDQSQFLNEERYPSEEAAERALARLVLVALRLTRNICRCTYSFGLAVDPLLVFGRQPTDEELSQLREWLRRAGGDA